MNDLNSPPTKPDEWESTARRWGVADRTIHKINLYSASKLQPEQFLMLRILWQELDYTHLDLANFGLTKWVEEASHILHGYQPWQDYYSKFNDRRLQGTFALPRFYQKQASRVSQDTCKFDVTAVPSPISKHTRQQAKINAGVSKLSLETPSKQPKTPRTPTSGWSLDDEHDLLESDDTPPEQRSYGPEELLDKDYPKTKDEQIVNTALIDFLNAFIVHLDLPVQWSLYRKPFTANFNMASLEARTDGCLEENDAKAKVHALVEVKPLLRIKAPLAIAMQEAAQMVAWIKSVPDPVGFKYSCGGRLHVSQDRNEIYIIFAEYDETYVKYLNNTLEERENPGFMKMHQFGPWDTTRASDMKKVGPILLGIALRGRAECQAGKPRR